MAVMRSCKRTSQKNSAYHHSQVKKAELVTVIKVMKVRADELGQKVRVTRVFYFHDASMRFACAIDASMRFACAIFAI